MDINGDHIYCLSFGIQATRTQTSFLRLAFGKFQASRGLGSDGVACRAKSRRLKRRVCKFYVIFYGNAAMFEICSVWSRPNIGIWFHVTSDIQTFPLPTTNSITRCVVLVKKLDSNVT